MKRSNTERPRVTGVEAFRLGRRLIRIGVDALPPSGFKELPSSVRMVLVDVIDNPGSTITQIVERTGFPQSHVSAAVARLRDADVLATAQHPLDRRCTVVSPTPSHQARMRASRAKLQPIDATLEAALRSAGTYTPNNHQRALDALQVLTSLLDFTMPSASAASTPAPSLSAPSASF